MDIITLEELRQMNLPPIIHWAAPVMFALVFLEWGISAYQKRDIYDTKDFLAASTIGIGNVLISALIKFSLFAVVLFFYNLFPWSIPPAWWSYPLCLIILDFFRYWAHRCGHEQRFWWATHVVHHNSEKYNFSVSFRLSWIQHLKVIFFLPVAMMGFHPVVFFIVHQIEVLYQFWIHTEYIKKLPKPIEFIFTTPSHHRVHHSSDEKYLDKNYGSTFIIWDRIFGTFQPEEERPNYGITKKLNTYNPLYLIFHEFIDLLNDLKKVKSFKQGFKLVFSKPGTQVVGRELLLNPTTDQIRESLERQGIPPEKHLTPERSY